MKPPSDHDTISRLAAIFVLGCLLGGGLVFLITPFTAAHSPVTDIPDHDLSLRTSSPATLVKGPEESKGVSIEKDDVSSQLKAAMALANPLQRYDAITALISSMNPSQIREALALFAAWKPGARRPFVNALLGQWATTDAAGALAYAQGLPTAQDRSQALEAIYGDWSEKDSAGALASAKQLPAGVLRNEVMKAVAGSLGKQDPKAAIELITSEKVMDSEALLESLFSKWAANNLKAAVTELQQMPANYNKNWVISSMIRQVTDHSPDKALDLIDQMSVGWIQNNALLDFADSWAKKDPAAALAWANQQSNVQVRGSVVEGIAANTSRNGDPMKALSIAESLPAGPERDHAIFQSIFVYTQVNSPMEAIAFAMTLPDGNSRTIALRTGVEQLTSQDAGAALSWARQQTNSELSNQIWPVVLEGVSYRDPQKASELALALPEGTMKTQALQKVADGMFDNDPSGALQLASSITNEEIRLQNEQHLASRWLHNDPKAATQWISNSTLPQSVKAKLLEQK